MLIVDSGPLYAAADARDPNHRRCAEVLRSAHGPLLVPVLAVAEVAYLIGNRLGAKAELAFGHALASGELVVGALDPTDLERVTELVGQYLDLPLGLADASVVALAERLGAKTIATLDRRHFSSVRPAHVSAFDLVP
ncbi:MAG: PIN domain-containing protein [Candidatus Dormibacteraeota bacterium]|nr:PIN domain-containing protein [Candidatus Dormibacteraeota bacterium]